MEGKTLFLLQFGSMLINIVMILFLLFARKYIRERVAQYEKSRWLLVSAMSILVLHYILQMTFELRASGDDVGVAFNILFYAPSTFLFCYAVANLECGRDMLKKFLYVGAFGYFLILMLFLVGLSVMDSFHLGAFLYAMDALFGACMVFFIFIPMREIRRTYRRVEASTGSDLHHYVSYIHSGFYLVCLMSVFLPFSIVSIKVLLFFGPVFYIAILRFVVIFITLGFNSSMLRTVDEEPAVEPEKVLLSAERSMEIERRLDSWVGNNGYQERDASLVSLSTCICVSRRDLTDYFEQRLNTTFRVWLSDIRFEAAKQMLLEHPEYSNEAISASCGFSSRSQLYNLFRDRLGMTPKEWVMRKSPST